MIADADELFEKGLYYQAEDLCRKEIEKNSSDVGSFRMLADILLRTGRIEEGSDYLQKALGLAPDEDDNNILYGRYLMAVHQYDVAVKILTAVFNRNPEKIDVLYHLAVIYWETKDYGKVAGYLSAYINKYPGNRNANQLFVRCMQYIDYSAYNPSQADAFETVLNDFSVSTIYMNKTGFCY